MMWCQAWLCMLPAKYFATLLRESILRDGVPVPVTPSNKHLTIVRVCEAHRMEYEHRFIGIRAMADVHGWTSR